MLYDPNNELTDEQMKELSEDDFFASGRDTEGTSWIDDFDGS